MIRATDIMSSPRRVTNLGPGFDGVMRLMAMANMDTPLLILSRAAVRKNLARLSEVLPGAAIHYAVKSNNHPAIMEEVARSGHGFDVASYHELRQVLEAGAGADKLIHSHPIKTLGEIDKAIASGILTFVVDNPSEIDKFARYSDKVRLLIRLGVKNSSAVVNLSYKFGCQPSEAPLLAEKMRSLGLDYHGLTFHVGSQCLDNRVYVDAIKMAAAVIGDLGERGFTTRLVDIGGGFPVPYTSETPSIGAFCRPISVALRRFLSRDIAVACEPGRFISATAVTLATSVIGKTKRQGKNWYFLDEGLYGSFSGRLYDHCQYKVLTNRNTVWKRSVLAGPTCDSFDVIYRDIILPPLEVGDILVFPSMGAYCSVSASTFNGLRKAEYIVID
jgi:ornithine decarboxylase